jgi:hypothetical protein
MKTAKKVAADTNKTAEKATCNFKTKDGRNLKADGKVYNNFNKHNSKGDGTPHLRKIKNTETRTTWEKYFDSVAKNANVEFNFVPSTYVGLKIAAKSHKVSPQFYVSASKLFIFMLMPQQLQKKLMAHIIASKQFDAKDHNIRILHNGVYVSNVEPKHVHQTTNLIKHLAQF